VSRATKLKTTTNLVTSCWVHTDSTSLIWITSQLSHLELFNKSLGQASPAFLVVLFNDIEPEYSIFINEIFENFWIIRVYVWKLQELSKRNILFNIKVIEAHSLLFSIENLQTEHLLSFLLDYKIVNVFRTFILKWFYYLIDKLLLSFTHIFVSLSIFTYLVDKRLLVVPLFTWASKFFLHSTNKWLIHSIFIMQHWQLIALRAIVLTSQLKHLNFPISSIFLQFIFVFLVDRLGMRVLRQIIFTLFTSLLMLISGLLVLEEMVYIEWAIDNRWNSHLWGLVIISINFQRLIFFAIGAFFFVR